MTLSDLSIEMMVSALLAGRAVIEQRFTTPTDAHLPQIWYLAACYGYVGPDSNLMVMTLELACTCVRPAVR